VRGRRKTNQTRWLPLAAGAAAIALPLSARAAPRQQQMVAGSIWPIVLAMAAAAFVVERVVELFWNIVEWALLSSKRWRPADLKTAHYLQFKNGVSLLLGATLGVLVAGALNLHLFAALELLAPGFTLNVPANWDVAITGLIIGVTAKPIHDLIELLAEFKNFMGNAAVRQREAAGAALADGVLKLAQTEAETMIEVPGMGRTPLAANGGYVAGEPSPGAEETTPTDKYIDILRNRTLM
jgi:hypothetical protein